MGLSVPYDHKTSFGIQISMDNILGSTKIAT